MRLITLWAVALFSVVVGCGLLGLIWAAPWESRFAQIAASLAAYLVAAFVVGVAAGRAMK